MDDEKQQESLDPERLEQSKYVKLWLIKEPQKCIQGFTNYTMKYS